jgi:hypothetical protein
MTYSHSSFVIEQWQSTGFHDTAVDIDRLQALSASFAEAGSNAMRTVRCLE